VGQTVAAFVEAPRDAFGDRLISVVLFGSAAEGRLRPTSDVNVIVVLQAFDHDRAARLSAAYQTAGRGCAAAVGARRPISAHRRPAGPAGRGPRRAGRRPRAPQPASGVVNGALLEEFLARLYVDAGLRARFVRDPAGEARRFGLDDRQAQALASVDPEDLERAAASFAHKRAHARSRRPWWRRLASRLRLSA
jgi:hypothetical protein